MLKRNKLRFLIGGFILFCIITYFLTVNKTIDAYKTYRNSTVQLEAINNAPAQIAQYKHFLEQADSTGLIKSYDRQKLFFGVNTFCSENHLSLRNFYPEQINNQNGLKVITNQIIVEGSFSNITKLAYYLEKQAIIGHISSLKFEKIFDRNLNRSYLTGRFFIQNVIPIKQ